jgi:hypothetical protein
LSDATDRTVAIKAVSDLVQPDVAPTLTTGEIELAVDRSRLAYNWTVNTFYKIGDVVVPPTVETKTGKSYECIRPGTSRSTPRTFDDWPCHVGAVFTDGSSSPQLTWKEVGTDRFNPDTWGAETNVYDIQLAAKRLARIKRTQCAQFIQDGDVSYQQMYDHWTEEEKKFKPFRRPIQLVRC